MIQLPNAYADVPLERRPVILKIHGEVDRAPGRMSESFVVSEDDHIAYLAETGLGGVLPVTLAARLRRSHFLFLGYGLLDWSLRVFLHRLWSDGQVDYRSWAVQPAAGPVEREFWKKRGVEPSSRATRRVRLIDARAVGRCGAGRSTMTTVAEAVRTPYKGLSPFDDTEHDALLFFGRERDTEIVVANALASRLTVLYGPSGVGKSSLLRAGVVHSLRKLTDMDPIAVAYYSSWAGDPLGGIEEAVRGALTETFGGDPGDAAGDLADRLDAWTAALGCELCLVLDQFEELFLYHEEGGLLEALPELVTRPGLRVNVVLGIRDDELAKLDIFKAAHPRSLLELPAARPARSRRCARRDPRAARPLQRARRRAGGDRP